MRSFFDGPITAPSGHQLLEHMPWQIRNVEVLGNQVNVSFVDSTQTRGTVALPQEQLKLIQYIGDYRSDRKTLYAELRTAPRHVFLAPPHRIVYLGDIQNELLETLKDRLKANGIDFVWYQTPRREKPAALLPEAASLSFG
jgi:hypothetical protein